MSGAACKRGIDWLGGRELGEVDGADAPCAVPTRAFRAVDGGGEDGNEG
jgi:hypothetical protein